MPLVRQVTLTTVGYGDIYPITFGQNFRIDISIFGDRISHPCGEFLLVFPRKSKGKAGKTADNLPNLQIQSVETLPESRSRSGFEQRGL
jgi:hypothetical protein